MTGLEAVMLVDVEHRTCDAPRAQRFDERFFLDYGSAPDVDQPRVRLHRCDSRAVEKVMRLWRKRAREHYKIRLCDELVQGRGLRLRRQAIEPALMPEHSHAETTLQDLREPAADFAYTDDAGGEARDFARLGAERAHLIPRLAAQRRGDRGDVAREHQHRHRAVLGYRLRVSAGLVRDGDRVLVGRGERDEIGPGAVDRNCAHARRHVEDVVWEAAARDDRIGLARQRADRAGIAVGRKNDLRTAPGEQALARRVDRVGEQNLQVQRIPADLSCAISASDLPSNPR
jgi:hypothetical protein